MIEILGVLAIAITAWFYCALFFSDLRGFIDRRGALSEGAIERAKFSTQKEYDFYIIEKHRRFVKNYLGEEYYEED